MNTHDLQAAVVTRDCRVMNAIPSSLNRLGIASTVYQDTESAIEALRRRKLDVFFVDRDLDPDLAVLETMRRARSNRKALAFAIIPREETPGGAFRVADFLIDKPMAPIRLDQALRAAQGFMLKERMSYFRRAIRIAATLIDSAAWCVSGTILNISQGGVALESGSTLNPAQVHQIKFFLPEQDKAITSLARVVWSDQHGRAGLCFTQMKTTDRKQLISWMESEFSKANAA